MSFGRRSMLGGCLSVSVSAVVGCTPEPRTPAVGDEDDEIITTTKDDPRNFSSLLTPYGSWIEVEGYGQVFQPSNDLVGMGFTPYVSRGHWLYSDEGWVFESELPFGWATFHYGRWLNEPNVGWVWQRGDDFAPSWVEWRQGGGYLGWAPLSPVEKGLRQTSAAASFVFVAQEHIAERELDPFVLPRERAATAMSTSQRLAPRAGETYSRGPDVSRLEAEAHIQVPRGSSGRDRGSDLLERNMPQTQGHKSHKGSRHGKHSSS